MFLSTKNTTQNCQPGLNGKGQTKLFLIVALHMYTVRFRCIMHMTLHTVSPVYNSRTLEHHKLTIVYSNKYKVTEQFRAAVQLQIVDVDTANDNWIGLDWGLRLINSIFKSFQAAPRSGEDRV
jgi:hypothetical protein